MGISWRSMKDYNADDNRTIYQMFNMFNAMQTKLGIFNGDTIGTLKKWHHSRCDVTGMLVYIYIRIHTYIHTSIHPSIHTSIHPYIHTSIHTYIHTEFYPNGTMTTLLMGCLKSFSHVFMGLYQQDYGEIYTHKWDCNKTQCGWIMITSLQWEWI